MSSYLDDHTNLEANQREQLDERQVKNAAGGFVYKIDTFDAVKRFLIIGTEGGTYYQTQRDLTKESLVNVEKAIQEDGPRVVQMAHDVSVKGQAIKNDMALFTLALAFSKGDRETKQAVESVYNKVARIGTHHLMFVNFINGMQGWGRALRRMVGSWYTSKDDDALAYQVLKYQNRSGWTHKDVLKKAHWGNNTGIYRYIVDADPDSRVIKNIDGHHRSYDHVPVRDTSESPLVYPDIVYGYEEAKALGNSEDGKASELVSLIDKYRLTHEMIPNRFKDSVQVWESLLQTMPIHATVRNLGKMSSIKMFDGFSENVQTVLDKFTPESVKKARLHPIQTLVAMHTYRSGRGFRGSLNWQPNSKILARLEEAFYWGFDAVTPSGKNTLLALDTSGSMFGSYFDHPLPSCPSLCCGEIAAVIAMVTVRTEPNYLVCCFDDKFAELPITELPSLLL
jgi:60 kDa SS-A/Ro ribonucleoprotein